MLVITIGRFIQFMLLFAALKMATTLMPPAQMAKVYLITSLFSIVALIFINPIGMFINRRIHSWNNGGGIENYFQLFWLYLLIVCVITYVVLEVLINVKLIQFHSDTGWIAAIVVGTLFSATVNQTVIPGLNLLGYRNWFIGLTLATGVVCLLASTLLVELIKAKAEYWQSGIIFGNFLVACLGWKIFYRRINKKKNTAILTKHHAIVLLKFALPIAVAVGLGWVQTQSYRFMMESSLGLHSLGLFAAGYGISAGLISAFESIFTTYLQPMFYKQVSNDIVVEQSSAWNDYAGAIFPSLILVGFIVIATAPELTRVMLGPQYQSSYQFIVWGVIAEMARVASGVYGMVAHARMKTKLLLAPNLVGAILSITLIWWLMPKYGSSGVGTALALSSVAACIFTYATTRNEFVAKLPLKMLVASMCMGVGIMMLTKFIRWLVGGNGSLVAIATILFTVGITFLLFQYILLRHLLHGSPLDE